MSIDPLAAIYDEFARTYDDNRGLFDMTPVIADFAARLPATGSLLDLGCGAGEPFAKAFLDRGWSVTGVDFSARMLELAARYVPRMTRVQGDMREVAFPPSVPSTACSMCRTPCIRACSVASGRGCARGASFCSPTRPAPTPATSAMTAPRSFSASSSSTAT